MSGRGGSYGGQRYMTDNLEIAATQDAPLDYEIEEGVLVDITEKRQTLTDRQTHKAEYAAWQYRSPEELRAEEARWAAQSGPVFIKRAPTNGLTV